MIRKPHYLIAVVAILALAAAAVYFVLPHTKGEDYGIEDRRDIPDGNGVAKTAKKNNVGGRPRRAVKKPSERKAITVDEFANFTPEEKKVAISIQDAIDSDNFEAVMAAMQKAAVSTNSLLRQSAVEAMGWFGEKALVEITPFMADPDEDVSEAAVNAWEMALSEVDSAKARLGFAKLVLATSATADSLAIIGGIYSAAANEYIDEVEDEAKATARRIEVLQPIIDIMGGERQKNSDVCKEIYEDITGFEWIDLDEANLYVSDPDNYELPEDSDSDVGATLSADEEPAAIEDVGEIAAEEVDSQADEVDDLTGEKGTSRPSSIENMEQEVDFAEDDVE